MLWWIRLHILPTKLNILCMGDSRAALLLPIVLLFLCIGWLVALRWLNIPLSIDFLPYHLNDNVIILIHWSTYKLKVLFMGIHKIYWIIIIIRNIKSMNLYNIEIRKLFITIQHPNSKPVPSKKRLISSRNSSLPNPKLNSRMQKNYVKLTKKCRR